MRKSLRTEDVCPSCGGRLVPVVFGMPGLELFEAQERGEVVLGGCSPMGPSWECKACSARFSEYELTPRSPQGS